MASPSKRARKDAHRVQKARKDSTKKSKASVKEDAAAEGRATKPTGLRAAKAKDADKEAKRAEKAARKAQRLAAKAAKQQRKEERAQRKVRVTIVAEIFNSQFWLGVESERSQLESLQAFSQNRETPCREGRIAEQ